MQLNLPPEIEEYVDQQVKSGTFESAESVVTAGLLSLRATELEAEIEEGYRQAEAGAFSDDTIEDIIRERRQRFEDSHSNA